MIKKCKKISILRILLKRMNRNLLKNIFREIGYFVERMKWLNEEFHMKLYLNWCSLSIWPESDCIDTETHCVLCSISSGFYFLNLFEHGFNHCLYVSSEILRNSIIICAIEVREFSLVWFLCLMAYQPF